MGMNGDSTVRSDGNEKRAGVTLRPRPLDTRPVLPGLTPYDRARYFLGLREHSWVNWSEEIRRRCGKELLHRRMVPPRKYFRNAS